MREKARSVALHLQRDPQKCETDDGSCDGPFSAGRGASLALHFAVRDAIMDVGRALPRVICGLWGSNQEEYKHQMHDYDVKLLGPPTTCETFSHFRY